MSQFNQQYNFHNSKIRNIIISVLALLQDKIKYTQFIDNNESRIIEVPFYFQQTGSEDFLTDYFMNEDYSKYSTSKTDGMVNKVPRGVLSFTSLDIDTGSMTNRFVRTTKPKKVDETTYKLYSYETMIIPINMSFDTRIICSSTIEMFHITESLISNLYKSTPFFIDFGGRQVRGYATVPENFTHERLFEFSYTDKKQYDITFTIDISTSFPVFDEKSEMFAGNTIQGFNYNMYDITVAPNPTIFSNQELIQNKETKKYD